MDTAGMRRVPTLVLRADAEIGVEPNGPRPFRSGLGVAFHAHLPQVTLAALFAISRFAFFLGGAHFQIKTSQYQLAAFPWLQHHLIQTIWYMHSQPPLYNLVVGLALKLGWIPPEWSLGGLYLMLGALLAAGLFQLARGLRASEWGSAIIAILIVCSPSALLYESKLSYDFLVAVGLLWLVIFFFKWASGGRRSAMWGLCLCAGALVLTRSLFHPLFYFLIVGLAVLVRRLSLRSAIAALVPLALVGTFVVKDYVIFGQTSLSSWFGMNFADVSIYSQPRVDQDALLAHHSTSLVTKAGSFASYASYAPFEPRCRPAATDPLVLREPRKTDGSINFNFRCFLRVFRQFDSSAERSAFLRPRDLIRAEAGSYEVFAVPPWRYYPLASSVNGIVTQPLVDAYEHSVTPVISLNPPVALPSTRFFLVIASNPHTFGKLDVDITGLISMVVTLALGGWAALQCVIGGASPRRFTLLLVALLLLYVAVVGNLFEIGENMRFREGVEPLCLVILGVAICRSLVSGLSIVRRRRGMNGVVRISHVTSRRP